MASTQSTATTEAYHHKYHATPAADDSIITIDKGSKWDQAKFVAESFEKWNWSSEANHQKMIADSAKKMKAKDCLDSSKERICELIKAIKEERAKFTKEFTNEFMFTRATRVKGIRFVKANNSFYARLVYQAPNESDPKRWLFRRKRLRLMKNRFEANLRNWTSSTSSICIKRISERMVHTMWK